MIRGCKLKKKTADRILIDCDDNNTARKIAKVISHELETHMYDTWYAELVSRDGTEVEIAKRIVPDADMVVDDILYMILED